MIQDMTDVIKKHVRNTLRQRLYPEKLLGRPRPRIQPRTRLALRLQALVILKELEIEIMNDIKADTEAVEDARQHGTRKGAEQ